jgi:glycosyltransferase involved in cell wall biosynthesis
VTEFADDVTVVIPHIPTRPNKLALAVKSTAVQKHRPTDIIIAVDTQREGSAATRNRALRRVRSTWTAFLDDDDYLLPQHLEILLEHARDTEADVIYPGCAVVNDKGQQIPRRDEWGRYGRSFDADLLRQKSYIPVTSLVRTEYAQLAWFGPPEGVDTPYDDWGFYLRLLNLGAKFSHVAEVTWVWTHHGANTSGQPNRW